MTINEIGSTSEKETRSLNLELLTLGEVAQQLRVSHATIYRLVDRGEIDVIRCGRTLRFQQEAVLRYVERYTTPAWKGQV